MKISTAPRGTLHTRPSNRIPSTGNVTNACVETRCQETDEPSQSDKRHRLHMALAEYFLRNNEKGEALYHLDRASEYRRLCSLLIETK